MASVSRVTINAVSCLILACKSVVSSNRTCRGGSRTKFAVVASWADSSFRSNWGSCGCWGVETIVSSTTISRWSCEIGSWAILSSRARLRTISSSWAVVSNRTSSTSCCHTLTRIAINTCWTLNDLSSVCSIWTIVPTRTWLTVCNLISANNLCKRACWAVDPVSLASRAVEVRVCDCGVSSIRSTKGSGCVCAFVSSRTGFASCLSFEVLIVCSSTCSFSRTSSRAVFTFWAYVWISNCWLNRTPKSCLT